MKLPVYLYGHPVLRRISEPIDDQYPDLQTLISDMYQCMYESEGVGLAAPQIGKNIKLIVIDASPLGEDFPECAGRKLTLINPELEVLDGPKEVRAEGCLSLPGLSVQTISGFSRICLSPSCKIPSRQLVRTCSS